MPRIRRNIWKLPTWNPTILWYARAVKALKDRDFAKVTSWRYLAAMHGIDEEIWRSFGWIKPVETLPQTPDFQTRDRDQCQHHGWYFLPWHRGYLAAFEAIIRAAIAELNGPANSWALPYWNYSDAGDANARKLPAAFATSTWPDAGTNPLFEDRRYGRGDGVVVIRPIDVDVSTALKDSLFEGAIGGSPGFGGVRTPFQHNADRRGEGLLEQVPHDTVHGLVGGAKTGTNPNDPHNWGLMSSPATAGLDPIFWIHHANIDRLWEVWLKRDVRFTNPTLPSWLDGPTGRQTFVMPQPDGSRHPFTARQMLDSTVPALDYVYDDTSDPLGGQDRLNLRLEALALPLKALTALGAPEQRTVAKKPTVELMGANERVVRLTNAPMATTVKVDLPTGRKLAASFEATQFAANLKSEPDRVFLNLENITGSNDAAIFDVYVGLAPGADPDTHPENRAGVVSLFGVRASTDMAQPHGGAGMTKVIEITDTIDRLHLAGDPNLQTLPVLFVPVTDLGTSDIEIKRVSIYRQST